MTSISASRNCVDHSEAVEADVAAAFNSAAERIEKAVRLLGQAGEEHHVAIG